MKHPKDSEMKYGQKNELMEVKCLGFFLQAFFTSLNSDKYVEGIAKVELPSANEG